MAKLPCRNFWTLIPSSRLKSANTHRDEALGVAILETVVVVGPSYLRHDFQTSLSKKFEKNLAGLPILKIQDRSQVPRPPYPKNPGKVPDLQAPYPENLGKIPDFGTFPIMKSHVMYAVLSFVLSVVLSSLLFAHVFNSVVFPGVLHVCVVLSFLYFCMLLRSFFLSFVRF